MNCFLHGDRPATRALNVPCAPDGKIWVCDECYTADPTGELRKRLFEKYLDGHRTNMEAQRLREHVKTHLRS